jgi:hypothetical protein
MDLVGQFLNEGQSPRLLVDSRFAASDYILRLRHAHIRVNTSKPDTVHIQKPEMFTGASPSLKNIRRNVARPELQLESSVRMALTFAVALVHQLADFQKPNLTFWIHLDGCVTFP